MMPVRERRIKNEWLLLQKLAAANPNTISLLKYSGISFLLQLDKTPAFVKEDSQINITDQHVVELIFRPLFPSVPIEAYLKRPVFHPNVHPDNGFVCLWNQHSSGETVIEALSKLRKVLAWDLYNEEAGNILQLQALDWLKAVAQRPAIPLPFCPLHIPASHLQERAYSKPSTPRRRLSPI